MPQGLRGYRWFALLLLADAILIVSSGGASSPTTFDQAIEGALPVARASYDYLHRNPELGKKEHKAHAYIRKELER